MLAPSDAQRFWPQFEYLLSIRTITTNGFQVNPDRSSVIGIQSLEAVSVEQEGLLQAKWGERVTTSDAVQMLAKNDVLVTNKVTDVLCALRKLRP